MKEDAPNNYNLYGPAASVIHSQGHGLIRSIHVLALALVVSTNVLAAPRLKPIANTAIVAAQSSNPTGFIRVGSQVFFSADDGIHGSELWATDGTSAGTRLVRDLNPGAAGSSPSLIGSIGGLAIMTTWETSGQSVWRSDGTEAGTYKLRSFIPQLSSYAFFVTPIVADSKLFVMVQDGYGSPMEVFVSDGTIEGTRDIGSFPVGLNPTPLGVNGVLYFLGQETSVGPQLWISDGTTIGTHMVRRPVECPGALCGPVPNNIFRMGNSVFFTTTEGVWKTDGTLEGTLQIAQIQNPIFVAASSTSAYVRTGLTLWRMDAGSTALQQVGDAASFFGPVTILDDGRLVILLSTPAGYDVWITGLTAPGLTKLGSVPRSSSGSLYGPIVGSVGHRLFFQGWTSAVGTELWMADIDTSTVALLKDIDARRDTLTGNSSNPATGVTLGSRIVFPATNIAGREVWQSDGTASGTTLLANIAPDGSGGMISGTIRDALTGNAVASGTAALCATICENFAVSDADGHFRFEGVIPRSYTLSASSRAHLTQFFDGINCPCPNGAATGTPVNVVAGFETTGIDFSLIRGGTISGNVVSASTGETVNGTTIIIRNEQGTAVDQVQSFLGFRSRALPTGTYYAETRGAYISDHGNLRAVPDQVYNGHNCPAAGCSGIAGDAIQVTNGTDTAGINFSLHEYATISGTVSDPAGFPIGYGLFVELFRPGFSYAIANASTDSASKYRFSGITPGTYYLKVGGGYLSYSNTLYPNVMCPSNCDVTTGTPLTVSIDDVLTTINVTMTQTTARLTGIVRDSAGAPLSGVTVLLRDLNGYYISAYSGPATTDATGRYVLFGMPGGTYYVSAVDELYPNIDCYYSPCSVAGATPIVLTNGQTTIVDQQVRSRRFTINGRLLDSSTGQRIAESSGGLMFYDSAGVPIGNWFADNGFYSYTTVSRSPALYVVASAFGWHATAYPNVPFNCSTTVCSMPPGTIAIPPGTNNGIDIVMPRFAAITGTVYDAVTGQPLQNADVVFVFANGQTAGNTFTDMNGHYRWQYATTGTYYAYVSQYGLYQYDGQLYRDHDCPGPCGSFTSGDPISTVEGVDTNGIDFHLRVSNYPGKITGRVVDDATGAGIADVYIGMGNYSARTDTQGYYSISGLTTGVYHLWAEAPAPYLIALYGGGVCGNFYTCNRDGGAPVQVTAPNTTADINFRLVKLHIAAVSPASGPASGGTRIVVTGANFTPQSTVLVGGTNAPISSITSTEIVALTPASPAGAAHVTVNAGTISVTLSHAFTFLSSTDTPMISVHPLQNAMRIDAFLPSGTTYAALYRREGGTSSWTLVSGWSSSGLDSSVPVRGRLYDYRLDVVVSGVARSSNIDSALLFTDDPLIAGVTVVKRAHFDELRLMVNVARSKAALPLFNFDASYDQSAIVTASHMTALRTALAQARTTLGAAAPTFTDAIAGGTMIKAIHVQELREQMR